MRIIIALILVFSSSVAFAELTSMADVRAVDRIVKTQEALDATTNKSSHSLKDRKIPAGTYFGKNYSYCDFENTDIRGCVFRRCNFSFAINLDKAISDEKTRFIESNLSGADLPAKTESCNVKRFTDKEIEDVFKNEI